MIRRKIRHLACGLLICMAAVLLRAQEPFDAFVERAAADWVRASPQAATNAQYFSGAEQDSLDRKLTATDGVIGLPITPAGRQERVQAAEKFLAQLATYDREKLTPSQRASAGMVEASLRRAIETAPLADHWFVFQQFRGLQVSLVNFLSQTHPIRSQRDIENYLERLAQVGPLLDLGIAEARARADRGLIPPKFILTATLSQIDGFLTPAPGKNVLVASLDDRAAKLPAVSAADRAAFVAQAETLVRVAVYPAFAHIRQLLAGQVAKATDDAGLWRFPQGAAVYAVALRNNTTTGLSAEEIHALGLREVARIEGEMDQLLRELGRTSGTVQARYDALNASLQPPATPDPRPAQLAEYTRIVRDAEKRAASYFDLRPKAPIEVRREPPFTEKSAAAHYNNPAPDGSRPGVFWVPLPGPDYNVPRMRTLAYHEAVPGHHFQIALQQELADLPRFRQLRAFGGVAAFAEGWGLYAEKLAAEAGWYEGDPQGRLGQLASELFRARRLVADTGLHAKHWTRQQAIDYGIPASEVERYIVMPGQACAYKLGELQILRVRAKAQEALGAKFSIKEFHNVLLRTGEVPLTVLAQVVDEYIASAR
jgi:uncharacterized protein (DUF885 family)